MLLCVHGRTSPRRSLAISAAVSGRSRRMTDRPNPIQIAAPPDIGKPHQQHGEKHAQVDHRGQRQRCAEKGVRTVVFVCRHPPSFGRLRRADRRIAALDRRLLGSRSMRWPFQTRSPAGRKRPPRPRKSGTPAPRRRIAGRTAPTPVPRPARRTRRSPTSEGWAHERASNLPKRRDASTNRNPTVANSAK